MAIERRLGEVIGPLAGKLHTGRSRNDQVATDVCMVVQSHSLRAIEPAGAPMERLLELAERHRDWAMPGYTHLQRAQPVYLGHHLLAYFWMLVPRRAALPVRARQRQGDAARLRRARGRQLGDRPRRRRRDLGFEHVSRTRSTGPRTETSPSTTSRRPRPARCTSPGSGAEIVLWSSSEFGFCELDEAFSSGSSIMPQKKNPDSAELLRGKRPRVAADI